MRSFCLQTAIVLAVNCVAILTVFPAFMCLDQKRRKHGLMDLFCCFRGRVKLHHDTSAMAERSVSVINAVRPPIPSTPVSAYKPARTMPTGPMKNSYYKLQVRLRAHVTIATM
jgi:hypothetical protein